MSQKATRKSQNVTIVIEDKEKVDNTVKDMKKKMAANAEKAAEKADKQDKTPASDKTDKSEPSDKHKPAEKIDKNTEKPEKTEKSDKHDKSDKHEKSDKHDKSDKHEKSDKHDKPDKHDKLDKNEKSEKTSDKKADKLDKSTEKKMDKSADKKSEHAEKEESKADKAKEKASKPVNGTHNGTPAANGGEANGTVSDSSEDELVIEEDELFPELTYDDSDTEFEPDAASRSLTRRSQSKVLKLKEDVGSSDRKLRSSDSPKPEKKPEKKTHDSSSELETGQEEEKKASKKDLESEAEKEPPKDGKTEEKNDKLEVEIMLEVESVEGPASRTRARVSPYSRPRLDRTALDRTALDRTTLDRTHSSAAADYTGNNSTMEMDITESPPPPDTSYLRGLRGIRGRASYKLLRELPAATRPRVSNPVARPTGAVVGRKRKPSDDFPCAPSTPATADYSGVEIATEAEDDMFVSHGKRMKLLDRLSMPFRRNITRRAAEIVGINTDLPLTAPVASPLLPPAPPAPPAGPPGPPGPLKPASPHDGDAKRCAIM